MKTNHPSTSNNVLAALLLLEVCAVLIPFFVLGAVFDFPDILRQPAAKAFALFHQNKGVIVPTYYLFLVSALLYFPLASLLKTRFLGDAKNAAWLDIMYVAGMATGVFQAIGFSRWIIAMPFLTEQYVNGNQTETIGLLYEWINRFVGTTVGEHLGFLAMGFWVMALSFAIQGSKWFKTSGAVIGLLLIASTLEHFGGPSAPVFATLNVIANVFWAVWMVIFAIQLLDLGRVGNRLPVQPAH